MRLQRRVARLEKRWLANPPVPPEDGSREERWESVVTRLDRLVRQADELLTDAEREQVRHAIQQLGDGLGGPYADWLKHLREGMCRLPDLTPAVMKDFLLAWLAPEANGGMVCRQCGLEYPQHKSPPLSEWKLLPGKRPFEGPPPWYDLPYLFEACPSCGASRHEVDWWFQTFYDLPWKQLDGFVGQEKHPEQAEAPRWDYDAGSTASKCEGSRSRPIPPTPSSEWTEGWSPFD
jgi:rubredoxin